MLSRAPSGVLLLVLACVLGGCSDDHGPSNGRPAPSTAATGESVVGLVDLGGRSLHYVCEGALVDGEPTILLLSGANLGVDSWGPVLDTLATGHHVCGLDRAGYGESDPAPERRRTTSDTVDDLLAATSALDLAPPYLLVAHSAGALEATLWASRAPEELGGLVLVDPLGPHVDATLRAALPPERPGEPLALAEDRSFLTVESRDPSRNPEHLDIAAGERQAAAALDRPGPLFGDLPVVVLQAPRLVVAGLPDDYLDTLHAAVDADMAQYAAESTDGTLVHVRHTGHMVMTDQPHAVVDAIDDALAR